MHLQGQDQSDQVHQHFVIGQLHAEDSQQGDESLVVTPPTAFLPTCQVDVSVEALSMLHTEINQKLWSGADISVKMCCGKCFSVHRLLTFLMNKLS